MDMSNRRKRLRKCLPVPWISDSEFCGWWMVSGLKVALCLSVTLWQWDVLGKAPFPQKYLWKLEVSGCVSRRHLEKLRLTSGKCKVIHKLRGIKFLLNDRMYIKVALASYRLINLLGIPGLIKLQWVKATSLWVEIIPEEAFLPYAHQLPEGWP